MTGDINPHSEAEASPPWTSDVTPRLAMQESIYRELLVLHAPLADLYEGARRMVGSDDPSPGWPHFIPHAVREISARVPDLIRGSSGDRLDYSSRMESLKQVWQRHGLSTGEVSVPLRGSKQQSASSMTLPIDVVRLVTSLVHDHIASTSQTFATRLKEAANVRAQGADDLWLQRWAKEWKRTHDWAQGRAHVANATRAVSSIVEYREEFKRFEGTLSGILSEFVTNKEGLDAILAEANRTGD